MAVLDISISLNIYRTASPSRRTVRRGKLLKAFCQLQSISILTRLFLIIIYSTLLAARSFFFRLLFLFFCLKCSEAEKMAETEYLLSRLIPSSVTASDDRKHLFPQGVEEVSRTIGSIHRSRMVTVRLRLTIIDSKPFKGQERGTGTSLRGFPINL